jgi:hypothetical protein
VITHILLIFIAASDSDSPTSEALLRALTDALGPTSRVTLRGVRSPPDDETIVEEVRSAEATAAVRLVWDDPGRVALHVYLAKGDETFDQNLSFQPSDPAEERGRALGFVIASHLLPPVRRAPVATVGTARPAAEARWALEGFGIAAVAPIGAGGGFGGAFGVRWRAGERWGVRAGALVRSGSVPSAQATSVGVGASLGCNLVLLTAANGLSLGGRAEAMLLYDKLTHLSTNHPSPVGAMSHSGVLPGAAAFAELEWRLAAATAIHFGLGVEVAFGTTDIIVEGIKEASIGALRGVAELGLRTRF